jgi:hypothetical protein
MSRAIISSLSLSSILRLAQRLCKPAQRVSFTSHGFSSTTQRPLPRVTPSSIPPISFPSPPGQPRPGVYRHYKSGDLYQVLGTVLHTETSQLMVLYHALQPSERNPHGLPFVRPSDMFMGTVEHDGQQVARFQFHRPTLELEESNN